MLIEHARLAKQRHLSGYNSGDHRPQKNTRAAAWPDGSRALSLACGYAGARVADVREAVLLGRVDRVPGSSTECGASLAAAMADRWALEWIWPRIRRLSGTGRRARPRLVSVVSRVVALAG